MITVKTIDRFFKKQVHSVLPSRTVQIEYATDTGLERSENQDDFFVEQAGIKSAPADSGTVSFKTDERRVIALFDGMGGEACGSDASRLAAETLSDWLDRVKWSLHIDMADFMDDYADDANDRIYAMTSSRKCGIGGTTMVLVCLEGNYAYCTNIGDSRLIVCDRDSAACITEDHTVAARKVRNNIYTEEEARQSREWSQLTAFLGMDERQRGVVCQHYPRISLADSRLILCSDGVSDFVTKDEMRELVFSECDNHALAIINAAMQNGSDDNVTCIVIG